MTESVVTFKKPSHLQVPTFDVFHTVDGTVSKYIHEDGSETAIKRVKSIQSVLNPITKEVEVHNSDRNKYSIFISSSVGCYMKCKFCHLTLKDAKFQPLDGDAILANLKEAVLDKLEHSPDLPTRFVKLSWMGMGDAINHPEVVRDVTLKLLDWIFENKYAVGLDGVDLSTVLPKVKPVWIKIFQELDLELNKYPRNPVYAMDNIEYTSGAYDKRSAFRLFYSVHSALQDYRENVVPNAMPLDQAVAQLNEFAKNGDHTVILHHVLVDGLNDTQQELDALIEFVNKNFAHNELRILRYNFCAKSAYKESEKFVSQIRQLSEGVDFLKVQVSPGSEVSAACGQFIVKDFVRSKKKS